MLYATDGHLVRRTEEDREFRDPGSRSSPVSRLWHPVLVVATLAIALSGCTSIKSGDTSTPPESSATALLSEAVSGLGPTEHFPGVAFPIPEGARSVVVDFDCSGGHPFSVELGDSMMLGQAVFTGVCEGTRQLAWPVTVRTGPTLLVMIPDGVEWVASPRFSTDEWVFDTDVTADCDAFSENYSAFVNADAGFTHYDAFDATEWTTRVDRAAAELNALAEASQTALADSLTQLHMVVTDSQRTVGAVLDGTSNPLGQIHQVCDANQTPIVVLAEFGG